MNLRPRKASWFVSGLLLVTVVSAGWELVVAQPESETRRPAGDTTDATFELLGYHKIVNISNITYTSDEGGVFDIYFACSSDQRRGPFEVDRCKRYSKGEIIF